LQTEDGKHFDEGSAAVIPERFINSTKQLYADVMKQTAILYSIL